MYTDKEERTIKVGNIMKTLPAANINKRNNIIIGIIIFLISFIVYSLTRPASLSFWDCGEYITCSSILGVPHPPGNPFYIILGKFFTLLPIGLSDAQKVSLMSNLFAAFAVLFSYLAIVKLVAMWEKKPFYCHLAGIIGALFIAFSNEFWTNAIEAEVYGGLAFFVSLIIWLTLVWREKTELLENQHILLLIIFLFFLGFCVHQTTLQIAPAILLIAVFPLLKFNKSFWVRAIGWIVGALVVYLIFDAIGTQLGFDGLEKLTIALFIIGVMIYYLREYVPTRAWWLALVVVILGLSPHLILPIRAAAHPFINEGDPSNFQRLLDYLLRRQYGPTSFFERRAPLLFQIDYHFLRYFSWQFFDAEVIGGFLNISKQFVHWLGQLIVALLGITGAVYQFKKNKRSFIYLASLFFMASIAMILVMNLSIDEVRERPYFFLVAYMLWAYWMGIGAMGIVRYFRRRSKAIAAIMLIIMCALPVVNMASQYHKHDRSNDLLALEYAENFLNGLDENAIIFTNGDNDTFPLWYAQAVYDPHADEYYLEKDTLKFVEIKGYHPSEIPEPPKKTKQLLRQAQLEKKELKGIRKDVSVANLSLLNTPWYIKQLRDQEGIEINLTDEQIDRIASPRGIFRLANDAVFKVGNIRITLPKDKIMYTKDQMVLQIINDNFGKRPIYFAVTVADRVGFDDYLQREGMADKLVETSGSRQFDYKRLIHNLENVFDFTTALNDNVYKDSHKKRLLNNYAVAFVDASNYFYQQNNYEKAAEYYSTGIKFLSEENKEKFIPGLSTLYAEMGEFDQAFNVIQPLIEQYPGDDQLLSLAVYYLEEAGKIDSTLTLIENFIRNNPTNQYFINYYTSRCQQYQKYDRGIHFFDIMSMQYPQNNVYPQQKNKLEQSLQEASKEREKE